MRYIAIFFAVALALGFSLPVPDAGASVEVCFERAGDRDCAEYTVIEGSVEIDRDFDRLTVSSGDEILLVMETSDILDTHAVGMKMGRPGENVVVNGARLGIGTGTSADPQAVLEVSSDSDGILIPRMTTSQRDAIPAPPEGLTIYNTDCHNFNYYDGTRWMSYPATPSLDPGEIIGSDEVCSGAMGMGYAVADVPAADTYEWSLPSGASIVSGDGTSSISVDFGTASGEVSVVVSNDCGSASSLMEVTVYPASVGGSVTGSGAVTLGESTGTLLLSGHTGTVVRWQRRYESGSWVDLAHTATTYSEIPGAAGTWEYRAVVLSSALCDTAWSSAATVEVTGGSTTTADTFIYTGSIVNWTVPAGVFSITIEAWGASGGDGGCQSPLVRSPGGLGARMKGTFAVTPGTLLKVLVGQEGLGITYYVAGGGGGSFVWEDGASVPMIVAGAGGGGGGRNGSYIASFDGIDAVITEDGTNGHNVSSGGGVDGYGGTSPGGNRAGGGCGWYSNGNVGQGCSPVAGGGVRPLEGGAGGSPGGNASNVAGGGFGGGGGGQGQCNATGGGGGGGYSGGGPGADVDSFTGGGGGGSFNSGAAQDNTAGVNEGNGRVIINW